MNVGFQGVALPFINYYEEIDSRAGKMPAAGNGAANPTIAAMEAANKHAFAAQTQQLQQPPLYALQSNFMIKPLNKGA